MWRHRLSPPFVAHILGGFTKPRESRISETTGGKDGPPGGQFRRTAIYPVGAREVRRRRVKKAIAKCVYCYCKICML